MKNTFRVSEVFKIFLLDFFCHILNENFKGQPISGSKVAVHTKLGSTIGCCLNEIAFNRSVFV